jgi:hypothetical protein
LAAVATDQKLRIEVLRLDRRNGHRRRFDHYDVASQRHLDSVHARKLMALLLDPRSYDRNTFSCDCFADYGIVVRSQGGTVELMVDRAKLVEVTKSASGRQQSWSRGTYEKIAALCAASSIGG